VRSGWTTSPLAVVDQNSNGSLAALYFIETDFANTPRYLRRASGNLNQPVWTSTISAQTEYQWSIGPV